MKKHVSAEHRPVMKTWMGAILASGIILCQTIPVHIGLSAIARTGNNGFAKDFLPPIATINPKLEQRAAEQAENSLEPVALSAVTSPAIRTSPKVDRLATDISSQFKSEQLENVLDIQRKVDQADLEHLWQATVEKNPVIRFALEKLATPADLQAKQSSRFLTKTLSMLISGATMGSSMMPGGGMYRNMGTMAVGNALQNLVNGKTQPTVGSLSATEQIQLAGLIDELKLKLIHNYQDYKNTLQTLAQSHEVTMRNNNLYSKALTSKNDLAIMAAGTAYYQALMNETTMRQKAKLYRLELERLAGPDAVSNLELAARVPTTVGAATATTSTTTLIGPSPEPEIGPQLPSASTKQKPAMQKATASPKSRPAELPAELPQAMMEISPTLKPDQAQPLIGPPFPQVATRKPANLKSGSQRNNSTNSSSNFPAPIPDKIIGPKENNRP